mmetsp:Transcript_15894/g.23070  ORF Transcript_15894/g.23070 Transcript_15894/m.23070 type:complete len:83 (-) Transcript_15894:67-315(-)
MTTHWDRITDESYRQWLIDRQVIAEEFNNWRFLERNEARSEFEKQQQQQPNGKLRFCSCILLVFKCCREYGNEFLRMQNFVR